MNVDYKKILMEYGCPNIATIKKSIIPNCSLSIRQVRDRLLTLGEILYEDLENNAYVVSVEAGYGNMNHAIVLLELCDQQIFLAGYSKEGIVKQNTCEKAFQRLSDVMSGKTVTKRKRSLLPFLSMFSLVAVVALLSICRNAFFSAEFIPDNNDIVTSTTLSEEELAFIAELEMAVNATKDYNNAVEVYNKCASEYNELVKHSCIDNISGLPKSIDLILIVSDNSENVATVIASGNNTEKINADTALILEMAEQIEQATFVVKQITVPSQDWVIGKLSQIESVSEIQAVTEDNNPDGLLKKEGGYIGCIYFSIPAALPNEVPGNNIVEKGTDAGGAIEIYATLEDAEARVEYLAGFDGTVLYSGSYALVGTMVIRTSYKLTNEQQFEMTNAITSALTSVTN